MERATPDEIVNKVLWRIPNVLCLVGSRSGDEWNAMTASWVTQASMEPVLVAVGVDDLSSPWLAASTRRRSPKRSTLLVRCCTTGRGQVELPGWHRAGAHGSPRT